MESLFEPVPELRALIKKTMTDLHLTPKNYVAAHFRSSDSAITYSSKETAAEELEGKWIESDHESKFDIENAIGCVHSLPEYKDFPIYFTASNTNDVKYALEHSKYADKNSGVNLVGVQDTIRFHSDIITRDHKFEEGSHYQILFPAFIDLYLLANSACVSFGKLGFGRLGGYISGEECMIDSRSGQCKLQK